MNDFREFSELYHYGIKGMHWGIRRYQNPDGSLTELGKKHYDQEVDVIKNQYNKKITKSEKKISKANEYLKLDKNVQKDKKVQKAKAVKAYEKAKIKMYKDLANAELKKLKDTPIDKIADKRSKDTGKAIAKSVLSTVALNVFFGSFVNPNNVHYNYYGGVAYGRDLNLLDSKERMDIINKDLASVTSKQGQRNIYYRDTYRPNNYISKRRNLKHGINDFRDVHEDYLMHFGILGMKWGIRRYQNPDGTLTEAGKKRYSKERTKDIQNVVKNTKAYSKERYDAINEIIDKHSKNNMPNEEELKAKKKYEDSLEPLKKSYHDKKEYNKACDLLASTMAKIYYPGDKESPYRYKAGLAFDDLDQSGEITMAYLINQGKSKKEIINIMKNAYKAQDEYYNHIKDRCDKILNDLGDIGDMQVGSQSYDKARYEIQHAVEDKGNYDGYNPYIAYLTDTSYSMGILNEMEKVYNNKEVTKMPEVSCHIYPAKFLDYKPGDYFEEYDELMKNIK